MIYSVGIYSRLSVSSHKEKKESIETQIEIAKAFMKLQNNMVLFDCYSDLGKTGTTFERKEFCRLMTDIREQKVNCVIVKDFSRFGRNYIETGNYIQKIFPFLNVRFISVTDQFDSLLAEQEEFSMNLKNLTNEMYVRDIAKKIKSSRKIQWEEGSYMGGLPPYGYSVRWAEGKKILFIQEEASEIVKELFRLYDVGKSMKELMIWLYEKKIHRPTEYYRYGHIVCQEEEILFWWSLSSIKRILQNPVYLGCLVSKEYGIKEHTHEALIEKKQYLRVAKRLEEQSLCRHKNDKFCNRNRAKICSESKVAQLPEDYRDRIIKKIEYRRFQESEQYQKYRNKKLKKEVYLQWKKENETQIKRLAQSIKALDQWKVSHETTI